MGINLSEKKVKILFLLLIILCAIEAAFVLFSKYLATRYGYLVNNISWGQEAANKFFFLDYWYVLGVINVFILITALGNLFFNKTIKKGIKGSIFRFILIALIFISLVSIIISISPITTYTNYLKEQKIAKERYDSLYEMTVSKIENENKNAVIIDIVQDSSNQIIFILKDGFKVEPMDIMYKNFDIKNIQNMSEQTFNKYIEQKNIGYKDFMKKTKQMLLNKEITIKVDPNSNYYSRNNLAIKKSDVYYVHAYLGGQLIDVNFIKYPQKVF